MRIVCGCRPLLAALICCGLMACSLELSLSDDQRATEHRQSSSVVLFQPSDIRIQVTAQALEEQYRVLSSMQSVDIAYDDAKGIVSMIHGDMGISLSSRIRAAQRGDSGSEILGKLRAVLLANGDESLVIVSNESTGKARRTIKADQFIGGIPVLYGAVAVEFDESTGSIVTMASSFVPGAGLPRQPILSATAAVQKALPAFRQNGIDLTTIEFPRQTPLLAYHGAWSSAEIVTLAWGIEMVRRTTSGQQHSERAWFDATDGAFLGSEQLDQHAAITTRTASNAAPDPRNYPNGTRLISSSEPLANRAMMNANQTSQVWSNLFGEDFGQIQIVVHYGSNCSNASSITIQGVVYLSFCDGNPNAPPPILPTIPYGNSLDVVAHEYGHGMALKIAALSPVDTESAALTEAFADFSSVLVDTTLRFGESSATWEIGEVYTIAPGAGIRSWSSPRTRDSAAVDWYPSKFNTRNERYENSHIFGHAFYLLTHGGFHSRAGQTEGGTQIPSLFVNPLGHVITNRIFFEAMKRTEMIGVADYKKVRAATEGAAFAFFGEQTRVNVSRAWQAVGLGHGCTAPPSAPDLNVFDHGCQGAFDLSWDRVAGATSYHAEMIPWGSSWSFALTVVDGNVDSCQPIIGQDSFVRIRACNGCGCGAWSPSQFMRYWPVCL
jgi:Zn-dependent metalloprotease